MAGKISRCRSCGQAKWSSDTCACKLGTKPFEGTGRKSLGSRVISTKQHGFHNLMMVSDTEEQPKWVRSKSIAFS